MADAASTQEFEKNKIVRVRADKLATFTAESARKFKDRIGVVVTKLSADGAVIVQFPQVGHRPAFSHKFPNPKNTLEMLANSAEVRAWQTEVADTARRKAQRLKAA